MKNVLRIFSFIIIPSVSIIFGLVRFYGAEESDKILPSFILITLASVVVIPLFAIFIGLSLMRYNMDATNDSFKKLNEDISKSNKDFIDITKTLISDTIARGNNYYQLHSHPNKDVLSQFISGIVYDFNIKIKSLSDGHLYEKDPLKYQTFCSDILSLANESIKATSKVNPNIFWEDKNTINYLKNNKKIIERGVPIQRFFYVKKSEKEKSLKAIANNLANGIKVFIIDEDDIEAKFIRDCAIVDKYISMESNVDGNRNIFNVDVYIGNNEKYTDIETLFDLLNSKKIEVAEFYEKSEDEIKKTARITF
jgi:hypothetical protein